MKLNKLISSYKPYSIWRIFTVMAAPFAALPLLAVVLILALACSVMHANAGGEIVFDVRKFGAVGDGQTDDTPAFLRAWESACSTHGALDVYPNKVPLFYVPHGYTFLLQHMDLNGPCASYSVHVQISGTLVAPSQLSQWNGGCQNEWIRFEGVKNLKVYGGGKIFGNGAIWWGNQAGYQFSAECRPTSMRFQACDSLQLRDLKFEDSPRNHISISGSSRGDVSNLHRIAPGESPNTDGIDLSHVSDIHIYHSKIETGDDCVAINGGSSRINIPNVHCGPGHGISVGSLGKNGREDTVEQVFVAGCTLQGTQNGVRIKTWPGGRGYARDITFQDINIVDSRNPIIIDQAYCARSTCQPDTNAVEISDITYSGVRGTSQDQDAVTLKCSEYGGGCRNIVMKNVYLKPSPQEGRRGSSGTFANCINAHGTAWHVYPQVRCLQSSPPRVFW